MLLQAKVARRISAVWKQWTGRKSDPWCSTREWKNTLQSQCVAIVLHSGHL